MILLNMKICQNFDKFHYKNHRKIDDFYSNFSKKSWQKSLQIFTRNSLAKYGSKSALVIVSLS